MYAIFSELWHESFDHLAKRPVFELATDHGEAGREKYEGAYMDWARQRGLAHFEGAMARCGVARPARSCERNFEAWCY